MRLVNEGSQLLVFGGRSGWLIIGMGLLVLGLVFGVLPLLLRRAENGPPVALAALGLPLLLAGIWAVGYRQEVAIDGSTDTLRIVRGNRFLTSPRTVPFHRIEEVGLIRLNYVSQAGNTGHAYWVMALRLVDGETVRIHDEEVDRELERVRSRGRRVAELLGVPFRPEPAPPD
jgi:hypothetical protein